MSVERSVSGLCKMQASLLVQNLNVTCCMVYVTERSLTGAGDRLISIAIEPESMAWASDRSEPSEAGEAVMDVDTDLELSSPTHPTQAATVTSTATSTATTIDIPSPRLSEPQPLAPLSASRVHEDSEVDEVNEINELNTVTPASLRGDLVSAPLRLSAQERATFPLSHNEEIIGIVVLYRPSIAWDGREQRCIETVVSTIECAIAMHIQNLVLRESLENTYLNDLDRQNHLSDLFHQVRNPLAALHVFGKLLDRRLAGNPAVLEIVENIIRESDRLKSLLDDLSVVAKQPSLELAALRGEIEDVDDWGEEMAVLATDLATDAVESAIDAPINDPIGDPIKVIDPAIRDPISAVVSPAPRSRLLPLLPVSASAVLAEISVNDLLHPILRVAETMAEVRDLTFVSEIACPEVSLRTDIKLMTEALQNVIDNALKYTPDGGRVSVNATYLEDEAIGDLVELCIRDTGLGIPPEDLDRVFQRGYRGEKSQMDIQGTGLGLQIVKQILEQLGADIAIDSKGRGQGVEVRLLLPAFCDA